MIFGWGRLGRSHEETEAEGLGKESPERVAAGKPSHRMCRTEA